MADKPQETKSLPTQDIPNQAILQKSGMLDLAEQLYQEQAGSDDVMDEVHAHSMWLFVNLQPLHSYMAPVTGLSERIELQTPEGRAMLKQALESPYMEPFFTVMPQLETQGESTCSITSLVIALNALRIHPGMATCNGEYCRHHRGSLACCSAGLKYPDVSLEQFAHLAVCNDVAALPVSVREDWTLSQLRSWVKMATGQPDVVMVANYNRKEVGEIGSGHFSPVFGYHESRDTVLFMDVGRYKYAPAWVPLKQLVNAMKDKDGRTDLHRGFVLLKRPDYDTSERLFGPSLTLRLDDLPQRVDPDLKAFVTSWNRFLDQPCQQNTDVASLVQNALTSLVLSIEGSGIGSAFSLLDMPLVHYRNDVTGKTSIVARCRRPQCPKSCPSAVFRQAVEGLDMFGHVQSCIDGLDELTSRRLMDLVVSDLKNVDQAVNYAQSLCFDMGAVQRAVGLLKDLYLVSETTSGEIKIGKVNHTCPGFMELTPAHVVTFLFLAWPCARNVSNLFGESRFQSLLTRHDLTYTGMERLEDKDDDAGNTSLAGKIADDGNSTADGQCASDGREMGDSETVREAMKVIAKGQIRKADCRVLTEQVKVMRRKIKAVLNYYQLLS